MDILFAVLYIVVGLFFFSIGMNILRFYVRRYRINQSTRNMDSGIYVEHGMVIDSKTGRVSPQQKSSHQAYSHFH